MFEIKKAQDQELILNIDVFLCLFIYIMIQICEVKSHKTLLKKKIKEINPRTQLKMK